MGADECPMSVRPACDADFEQLPEIQAASRELLIAVDHAEVLCMPVVSGPLIRAAAREGGLIVAACADDIVGFGLCERIGRFSHLHQMSVRPRCVGHGIGSTILCRLLKAAKRREDEAMTLITYTDIPWNRPFYARRGFIDVPLSEAPEYLSRLLAGERALGVDISRRTMMAKMLNAGEAQT
jgi:GNAT superfamily N-acetyltransferase